MILIIQSNILLTTHHATVSHENDCVIESIYAHTSFARSLKYHATSTNISLAISVNIFHFSTRQSTNVANHKKFD
jgi:hypothetical protein